MKSNKNKIIIGVLIVVIVLLSIRVVFDSKFDKFGQDLDNLAKWKTDYLEKHPNATDEEIDQAFEEGIDGLVKWKADYLKEHPDATDEEIDEAFKKAWGKWNTKGLPFLVDLLLYYYSSLQGSSSTIFLASSYLVLATNISVLNIESPVMTLIYPPTP